MKLLLCNGAHIGDVVLSTALLPAIKRALGGVQIGFLVGSSSRAVVEDHLLVDYVHLCDDPYFGMPAGGAVSTWRAKEGIQAIGYDVAIDLYSLYPVNSTTLLFASEIPLRIGYNTYDNARCLNHFLSLPEEKEHMIDRYTALLLDCGILSGPLKPCLMYKQKVAPPMIEGEYIVIHMGTTDPLREWPDEKWHELCRKLHRYHLVFAGKGEREKKRIRTIMQGAAHATDLCNSLSWQEFLSLVQHSRLLIGVESMAAHVAAVFDTPSVVIYGGFYNIVKWKPYSERCTLLLPSSHLFDDDGYASSGALASISAETVYLAVEEKMNRL